MIALDLCLMSSQCGNVNSLLGGDETAISETRQAAMKILVPLPLCGSLLGKSGCIISNIKQTTGARVKLSQTTELFPGTSERIVVLSGTAISVFNAIEAVITRLLEVTYSDSDYFSSLQLHFFYQLITPLFALYRISYTRTLYP